MSASLISAPYLSLQDREFVRDTNSPKVDRVNRVFQRNPRVAFSLAQITEVTGIKEGSVARAIRELRAEGFDFKVDYAGSHAGTRTYLYTYAPKASQPW